MNAMTLSIVAAEPVLPAADEWHQTAKAQAIIAAMVELTDDLRERLTVAGLDEHDLRAIGYLERRVRAGQPETWTAYGFVGELLGHLTDIRDDAADRIYTAAVREHGWQTWSEEADAFSDQVAAHLDSVDAAITCFLDTPSTSSTPDAPRAAASVSGDTRHG